MERIFKHVFNYFKLQDDRKLWILNSKPKKRFKHIYLGLKIFMIKSLL